MKRLALLVGIDDYADHPLMGCAKDATAMASLLARHHDGSPNFDCVRLDIDRSTVDPLTTLERAVRRLFTVADVEVALFYFAGHSVVRDSLGGRLVTHFSGGQHRGLAMVDLVALANQSTARERLIVLDCCHAGAAGDVHHHRHPQPVGLTRGVALLAGSGRHEPASEGMGGGLFTGHLRDALHGGAADLRGHITLSDIYAYLNLVLSSWAQQPEFHANLTRLTVLRRAAPSVTDEKLRRLTSYFPHPEALLALDPSFEPSAKPPHEENEATFSRLQQMRAARLIEPVGTEHMYYAAMDSKPCQLTPLGQFYWRAVKAGKI